MATFRPHLHQRCLLLVDGFYEKGVLFRQPGGPVFCLAGLWREESGVKKYTMLAARLATEAYERLGGTPKSRKIDSKPAKTA